MAIAFDRSLDAPYGTLQPISPLIQRVLAPNPGPFTFRGTGVYIIGAGESVAVIDPGPDLPEHIEALKRAIGSRRVSHILITHTHNDHSPAARPLKEWSGAKVYAFGPHGYAPLRPSLAREPATGFGSLGREPQPTASALRARRGGGPVLADEITTGEENYDARFVPDVRVSDGTQLRGEDFTVECVFTPGHTSNHMCYALKEEKALFTGDHVMGWSTSVIAPPDGNMGDYMRSLEKLIARDDAILYPTHGSPIAEPRSLLRAYLTHRRMREAQIAACLERGETSVPTIRARLYADLKPALLPAASLTILAHLEHMQEESRVARDGDRWQLLTAR